MLKLQEKKINCAAFAKRDFKPYEFVFIPLKGSYELLVLPLFRMW